MFSVGMSNCQAWAEGTVVRNSADGAEQIFTPRIYTIYNISVDETARTSSLASRAALGIAQRLAMEKLLRKIIREEDNAQLPPLSDGQITELVSGIEIANEKSSRVRYMADITVHFSRDKIYNFLSVNEIPFAETLSNPVSILAVIEKDGAAILWEKDNDWRKAWLEYDTVNNLVPIRIIAPSLAHRMAITVWQAQRGDRKLLQKFAEQMGIRKLYVMNARLKHDMANNRETLELTIFRNGGEQGEFSRTIAAGEAGSENRQALYDEAIKQATYWIDNQWKERVMIHFGVSSHLNVRIEFDRSEDWFEIKKRLEAISLIRKMIYKSFTIEAAEVDIEHSGDVEQIILTLGQENLILSQTPANMQFPESAHWVLTLKK